MAWKIWRQARERERADELGVSIDEVRVGPVTLTGWRLRWLAQILPDTTLYQFLRMLEVPAIIIALAAFGIDYLDRGTDRATRRAQLLAQVAQLATIEHPNASGGIKPILEFLADEGVSMRGIALERIKLVGVDLERARLPFAHLAVADLTGANLAGANLAGANLIRASLRRADLTGADLTDADLAFADLAGANLIRASLRRAELTGAELAGADLAGADLRDANLTGAHFTTGTNVTQEQLDSACITEGGEPSTLPEGLKPPQKVCAPVIV